MLISVLIAAATGPINMFVDFLFDDVIAAPLADEYKAAVKSRQFQQRVGRRLSAMSTAARNAIRESVFLAKNAISPSVDSTKRSVVQRHASKSTLSRLTSSIFEQFAVPDATVRKVPPSVVSTHSSTVAVLKGFFGDQYESNVGNCHDDGSALDHDVDGSAIDSSSFHCDALERGDGTPSKGFDGFTTEVLQQYDQLHEYSRREFRERWGFKPDAEDAWGHRPRRRKLKKTIISALCGTRHGATRKDMLLNAMTEVEKESERKVVKLSVAPDSHIGLEIMHLFIVDLLGYVFAQLFFS